jgi:hypothetical protein
MKISEASSRSGIRDSMRSPKVRREPHSSPGFFRSPDQEALVSLEAFKAVKRYGVPVEWYVYPGEGHVKFQPRNKYFVYQRNLDWMNFWLQGKEDPDPAKREQYGRWRAMREALKRRQSAITR